MALDKPCNCGSGTNSAVVLAAIIGAIGSIVAASIISQSPRRENEVPADRAMLTFASTNDKRGDIQLARDRWQSTQRELNDFEASYLIVLGRKATTEKRYFDARDVKDKLVVERIQIRERIADIPNDQIRTDHEIKKLELTIPSEFEVLTAYEAALSAGGSLEHRLTSVTNLVDLEISSRIESQLLPFREQRETRDRKRRESGPQAIAYSTYTENSQYANEHYRITREIEALRPQILDQIQKPIIGQYELEVSRVTQCKCQLTLKTDRLRFLKEGVIDLDQELNLLQDRLSRIPQLLSDQERDVKLLEASFNEVIREWQISSEKLEQLKDTEMQTRKLLDDVSHPFGLTST